jgi:hypothetical protein
LEINHSFDSMISVSVNDFHQHWIGQPAGATVGIRYSLERTGVDVSNDGCYFLR